MTKSKWTNEFLDTMRFKGDSVADCAAKALWENKNSKEIIDELRIISRNHKLDLKDFPKEVSDYFQITENVEICKEDQEKFDLSAKIFNNYGFCYCGLLFFKALPTGYMCPKPGHVLESTKLLVDFAARRVMETAQYVFAVNNVNWHKPGNPGLESIQRVRLMHAGMRMALMNDPRPERKWNMEYLGVPINQEDLALTNHLFSLSMIQGLDEMGIHLYPDEREAVLHTWQHIGQTMGICKELYVPDYKDAWDQYKTILHRQSNAVNKDGPVLTRALLESLGQMVNKTLSIEMLEDITNYFINDKRAWKSLGLHKPTFGDHMFDMIAHFLTSLKIWQTLFHRENNTIRNGWLSRIINYAVCKRFGLDQQYSRYPKTNLLETVSKIILNELSKRDLQNFEASNSLNPQKPFFFENNLLYEEWDLGGFNLDVEDQAVMGK
ncbi:MAG: DUF2236 domain-containing protein [Saprospiraceae bacterium]|nr:DUF2236 domain-containing protein [Saprospiraceae bacterium]